MSTESIYKKRQFINGFNLTASVLTTVFGLFWLAWLLWMLFSSGLSYINWDLFTQDTPGPGSLDGGLRNAIVGSLILTVMGVVIGTPIGLLAGTYLSEYGRGSKIASVVRFVNDILLSAPSIIIGVFVITLFSGNTSAWAGGIALAIIILPVIVRTTEDMLRLVPDTMREAAAALGAPIWKVITKVVYRAARAGLMTGIILGLARIAGETAPLLLTVRGNSFFSLDLNYDMASLPVVINNFASSPYSNWINLAWAGALLIAITILLLNIVARVALRQKTAG